MRITSSSELAAPSEVVWAALTDFAAYRDWNPVIVYAEPDRRGRNVRMHFDTSAEERLLGFDIKILKQEPSKRFRARVQFGVPIISGGLYALELAEEEGHTRLSHELRLSGVSRAFAERIGQRIASMDAALAQRLGASGA